MKIIKYQFLSTEINRGTKEQPNIDQIILDKTMTWSEANEEIVKAEAYNGEYTIEDDGVMENTEPTQLDRIEAQLAYTAMITDTLLEV